MPSIMLGTAETVLMALRGIQIPLSTRGAFLGPQRRPETTNSNRLFSLSTYSYDQCSPFHLKEALYGFSLEYSIAGATM